MAGSVNKVILIGNLGRDPESRSFSNGGKVVKFSLATSETWTRDGDRQERTEWHNVVIYDEKLGDVAQRFLRKGSKCYIEGAMQYREYDDSNGQKQKIAEVVLQRFRGALTLLDSREGGGGGGGRGGYGEDHGGDDFGSGGSTRTQSRPQPAAFDTDLDDDVPF
jgi:single-strand DNA-binding protein